MSASAAVMYPKPLKLGGEVLGGGEDLYEDVFVTDVDRDLAAETRPNKPGNKAATISEEWRKLQTSRYEDASEKIENEPSTVVRSQPRGRLSEADVFLQPSQVEEMLGQNSLLLGMPVGGGEGRRDTVVNGNDSTSSAGTISVQCDPTQPPMTPLPARPRRTSLWDGFIACINPLVGTFKKDKHSSKEDEWEVPFADIRELDFIGSGSQGAVFVGEYLREKVAVKKVKDVSYCEEARHLRKLRHPNIVKFKGVCTKPPCFCVILEFCPGGTLYDYIRSGIEILPSQVVGSARQIGAGMLYLHNKKIIHRDLKSLNILICDNNILKIADFGVSRDIGDRSTKMTFVGTVGWMSPEMIRHEPCSEKVDVWSYGVLLWELLMQERPYNNVSSSAVIWGVGSNNLHLPIPATCPVGLKVLLEMCWQPKPKNRPSFRQILMHLDLAAGAFLNIPPDTYLMTQENWRGEIELCLSKLTTEGIPPHDSELVHKREEELRHAQDVRLLYEQRLHTADRLYRELKSCKMQLDAKELELQRRERKLVDVTYKMKRHSVGGAFTGHLGTPPRDSPSSDSSEEEVDGGSGTHHHGPMASAAAAEKATADSAGTPLSGWGKKKVWRRKRRQSGSKDDKLTNGTGFLDKVTNSDRLTRKQALPPLNTIAASLSHDPDCDPATPTLDDPLDTGSRESTPRPKNSGTPLTPNGTFSQEVSELLDSVRHPRRNVSGSSTRAHRRQGSNGSFVSGCSLETTPLRGHSTPTTAVSSKRASIEPISSRRGSNSGVPYTRMDSSSSESNSGQPEHIPISATAVPFPKQSPGRPCRDGNEPEALLKDLYSNESSMDTQHESDGQGHEADRESASDGCENQFYHLSTSGTEPNETQSSAPSPSLAESDELTSSSAPDMSAPNTDVTGNPLPKTHSEVSGYGSQPGFPGMFQIPSLTRSTQSQLESWSHDMAATPTKKNPSGRRGSASLADSVLMSSTEYSQLFNLDEPDASPETSLTGFTSLSMPFHLRRLENHDDDSATPTPATPTSSKPKINSVTAIVRSFFENMSNKPNKQRKLHSQDSSEIRDDSGFQSPQAGVCNET